MALSRLLSALALVVLLASPQFSSAESADTTITFTKDIAPILQEKCQACHRPDSMAPMSLVTYEDVRPWAKAIRERVLTRQMPPWHIDKTRLVSTSCELKPTMRAEMAVPAFNAAGRTCM